jgi:phage terminase Nu1 subunit (DNA packaging protein)
MKDDATLRELVENSADLDDIRLYLDERRLGFSNLDDKTVMRMRREADMLLAQERAALATIERKKAERELVESSEVVRVTGRCMQTLKNVLMNIPPKVRQAYQGAETPTQVEGMVTDIIHDGMVSACKQLEEIS